MAEAQEVKHIQVEQRYKVQFERSAVKGVDGFKVESNGDELTKTIEDAHALYDRAIHITTPAPSVNPAI